MHHVHPEIPENWNSEPRSPCCVYVYSSNPQPILPVYGRPKYRNNNGRRGSGYYNVMWDPRVCRGNPREKQVEKSFIQCFNVRKSKQIIRQPRVEYKRPPAPPSLWRPNYEGKPVNNMEIIDPDRIQEENSVAALESTLDLPQCPSHPYPSTTLDKGTEILPGEIFDFDRQALPIVEALVGSVCERAIHELLEEEELASLRDQQAKFEAIRSKEQLKLIQLKEQHDRLEAERIRVKKEAEAFIEFNKQVSDRIQAIAFSSLYLGDPLTDIVDGLRKGNTDEDTSRRTLIANAFTPWLNQLVEMEVKNQEVCRNLLDNVILNTVQLQKTDFFRGNVNQDQEELQRLALLESARGMRYEEEEYGENE